MSRNDQPLPKNPLKVAAGRMNGRLRRPWSAEDRAQQRENALTNRPWQFATGPRTQDGKRRSASNGHKHASKPGSRRSAQEAVADVQGLIVRIRDLRGMIEKR